MLLKIFFKLLFFANIVRCQDLHLEIQTETTTSRGCLKEGEDTIRFIGTINATSIDRNSYSSFVTFSKEGEGQLFSPICNIRFTEDSNLTHCSYKNQSGLDIFVYKVTANPNNTGESVRFEWQPTDFSKNTTSESVLFPSNFCLAGGVTRPDTKSIYSLASVVGFLMIFHTLL